MQTPRSMREAVITADVHIARLDGRMRWINTCPVATQMGQMPVLVDKAVDLLLAQLVVHELGDDAVVED